MQKARQYFTQQKRVVVNDLTVIQLLNQLSTRDKSIYIYSISLMENQSNFMKRGMYYERICKDDL